jgi:hypothetical protein
LQWESVLPYKLGLHGRWPTPRNVARNYLISQYFL